LKYFVGFLFVFYVSLTEKERTKKKR